MLYIHIPFCRHKCTYCAFFSVASRRNREQYVDALCCELRARKTEKPLKTIYFGGGTPSQLAIPQLASIVDTLRRHFDLSQLEEVTLEANPDDLSPDFLSALQQLHFFNRLSIGVQSFNDNELHLINRAHSGSQALQAIHDAHSAGFLNISVDLIMGLPSQTLSSWQSNLKTLSELPAVQHLSCYELSVEQGSILERQLQAGRIQLPDEDTIVAQYQALQQWCKAEGFLQYEVSNYCRPGFHSRHNSRYWDRTPYIGVGAAAHSFDGHSRRWNLADIDGYISGANAGNPPHQFETLTPVDAFNEYLMTALRTTSGIQKAMLSSGDWEYLLDAVQPFINQQLLLLSDTALRPTAEGLLHADGIAASLFKS